MISVLYLVKSISEEIHIVRVISVALIRSIENIGVIVIGLVLGVIRVKIRRRDKTIIVDAELYQSID